jgi:hypothetical protein
MSRQNFTQGESEGGGGYVSNRLLEKETNVNVVITHVKGSQL